MKKFLSIALILVLVLSAFTLVSCKDKNSEEGGETTPATKNITVLGNNFSISSALSEMSVNVTELSNSSIYMDQSTGAKLIVSGAVMQGMDADEMKTLYPQNAEEAKAATSVSAIYTYDEYVYETTSYGCKFSFRVDMGMGEISYRTAYYFIDGFEFIQFVYEEKDAARPCGESFAVLAS